MWFDTLILQLRLHMAYRVNGILYRLRFLRLPYENSFAKTLGLVLAVLREIFGMLLGKLLYMAVFFAAPLLLIRRELPPELYGHLLVFLTLIGGIFNNNLLNGGRDAYYAVILLRMDARRYTLSAYGYYLLKTAVGFLAAALLVGHLILRQGLALCLLTPVLVCGVKLLSAGLELRHFHRRSILPRDEKRFSLLQGASVLLLAAAYLPPLPCPLPRYRGRGCLSQSLLTLSFISATVFCPFLGKSSLCGLTAGDLSTPERNILFRLKIKGCGSPWLSAPFLLCLSRQISLRETSLHQLHQGIYRFLLISAIGDDLNGRAAHDAQGKNTQQALGVYPALFLLHPNGSLVLIGLLDKKSRGPRVQTNMILNGYFFCVHIDISSSPKEMGVPYFSIKHYSKIRRLFQLQNRPQLFNLPFF